MRWKALATENEGLSSEVDRLKDQLAAANGAVARTLRTTVASLPFRRSRYWSPPPRSPRRDARSKSRARPEVVTGRHRTDFSTSSHASLDIDPSGKAIDVDRNITASFRTEADGLCCV